jgi:hypothetical protein
MRYAISVAVITALLWNHPVSGDEDLARKMVGSWRLVSLKVTYVGETAERDVLGANPIGRIVFSADHHFAFFVARRDRKPPQNDADAAALIRSMVAYTGDFRIEGDRAVFTVDGAWTESYPKEQIRTIRIDGDTLTSISPEQPSTFSPGKQFTGITVYVRERAT